MQILCFYTSVKVKYGKGSKILKLNKILSKSYQFLTNLLRNSDQKAITFECKFFMLGPLERPNCLICYKFTFIFIIIIILHKTKLFFFYHQDNRWLCTTTTTYKKNIWNKINNNKLGFCTRARIDQNIQNLIKIIQKDNDKHNKIIIKFISLYIHLKLNLTRVCLKSKLFPLFWERNQGTKTRDVL